MSLSLSGGNINRCGKHSTKSDNDVDNDNTCDNDDYAYDYESYNDDYAYDYESDNDDYAYDYESDNDDDDDGDNNNDEYAYENDDYDDDDDEDAYDNAYEDDHQYFAYMLMMIVSTMVIMIMMIMIHRYFCVLQCGGGTHGRLYCHRLHAGADEAGEDGGRVRSRDLPAGPAQLHGPDRGPVHLHP